MGVTPIEGETCKAMIASALADAADELTDAEQGTGVFVVFVDDCGEVELIAQANLHDSEIVAASFTLAARLAAE